MDPLATTALHRGEFLLIGGSGGRERAGNKNARHRSGTVPLVQLQLISSFLWAIAMAAR